MKTKSMFTRSLSVAIGMLPLMMMAFTATPAFALGTVWDGGTGNWSDNNWSGGQAPDPAGAMTNNAGAVTVTASTTAGSLTLGAAASLTVNAGQDSRYLARSRSPLGVPPAVPVRSPQRARTLQRPVR